MTQHLWVNHQASDKMRKEKVLKTRKKTEEEDEFNGLVKKKDGRKKKQIQEAKKKALSDHRWHSESNLAVVDKNGVILDVNDSWRNFAKMNMGKDERTWGVSANYFVNYDQNQGDTELAEEAFEGVRKVQRGELTQYHLEYPCHSSDDVKQWFLLNVLPLKGSDGSVMVSHTNITTYISHYF